MKPTILRALFLDNPAIPEQAYEFCQSLPGYQQVRQEYQQLAREVEQALGRERYFAYESTLNSCWAMENQAYYLFGLKLRRELLWALQQGLDAPRP